MSNQDYSVFDPNLKVQPDRTIFPGENIEVWYNRQLCIHAAECGRGLKEVFNAKKDPWIDPDKANADQVAKVVMRCPTGALNFKRTDGGPQEPIPESNTVVVSPDGPFYMRGEIIIQDAAGKEESVQTRLALCRCGASANKPYCDGAHEKAGFRDAGPVNSDGGGNLEQGGPLRVTALKDGPLQCSGAFTMRAASGRDALQGTSAYLCRCGGSANKPFCDGAHAIIGFRDNNPESIRN
ncbi:MAG: CDGSH iron-sulfur domain-containing protein [Nostocaceae cyanobacterium]|nr:CDGSH iron-sulfur domain-containing protein [Nostocaceae cyanobacterium]